MDLVEKFANETVEKYATLADHHQSLQHLETLKEKNINLKNVNIHVSTIY